MIAKLFDRGSDDQETLQEQIEKARSNPLSIGNLAVELGYCTPTDIEEALKVQRERLKLGQILVDLGKLTEDQLADLVIEQRIRKGEKVSTDELRRHERSKFHRRVVAITDGFRRAGNEAKETAQAVTACLATVDPT